MKKTGFDIKNPALADLGHNRIEWARREMPVLRQCDTRSLAVVLALPKTSQKL